jgi:hypothetical protein
MVFSIKRITVLFVAAALVLIMQSSGLTHVFNTTPNLILLFLLALIFPPNDFFRVSFADFFAIILVFLVLSVFWFPFWWLSFLILILISIMFYFLKRYFTGDAVTDFFLGLIITTLIFHAILTLINHSGFAATSLGLELIYNLILGGILWWLISRLKLAP